ncbi:MAG: septal ring lytic transglycosylase RlpA family protein [Chitinivibrionales bacterium]
MRWRNLKSVAVICLYVGGVTLFTCSTSPRYTRGSCGSPQQSPAVQLKPKNPKKLPVGSTTPYVTGTASYYGKKFHGRQTANGEQFNMYEHTAAHRKLPFDTRVRVTNLSNNRTVIVRINDRGPFVGARVIDLSYGAAKQIDMIESGTARVRLEVLK